MTLAPNYNELIQKTFKDIEKEALNNFKFDGYESHSIKFTHHADLRYAGQEHYVKVLLHDFSTSTKLDRIIESFHREHQRQYSFSLDNPVELVNFHLVAEVEVDKPDFPKLEKKGGKSSEAEFDAREVDFDDLGKHKTNFYHRSLLEPDMVIDGPAVIAENATTTVLTPLHRARVDYYGNLILTQKA